VQSPPNDAQAGTATDAEAGGPMGSRDTDAADEPTFTGTQDGSVPGADAGASGDAASDAPDCSVPDNVICAQGASCACSSSCSISEGTGASACNLSCTCSAAATFDCTQDCPPDAAPPTNCVQDVSCVPGVQCGGNPPVCLCDNTGHLQCPPGWDGGP
jgi:hypothetical protein